MDGYDTLQLRKDLMNIFAAYHVFTKVFCEYYDNREKGICKYMYMDLNVALCDSCENGNLIFTSLVTLDFCSADCGNNIGRLKRRKGIADGGGFVILRI